MASSDALLYVKPQMVASGTGARTSAALMFASARLVSGAYTPNIKDTSSRQQAWRPRAGSPIGYVIVGGQKLAVMPDNALMQWLDTLADRLGGPSGVRLPDVVTTVEQSQVTAAENSQRTQAIAQQAAANAASLAAAREVLQNAGVPGADQIPPPVLDGGNYNVP
jgi:hypothetical protein